MSNKRPEFSEITRREFLTLSGASVITVSSGKETPAENNSAPFLSPQSSGAAKAIDDQKPWYATMRRCGQINFNERDPIAMDVNA